MFILCIMVLRSPTDETIRSHLPRWR